MSLRLRDLGLLLGLVACAGLRAEGSEQPAQGDLTEVLAKAGRYVAGLGESLALVRAREHYVQNLTSWRKSSSLEPLSSDTAERQVHVREHETRTLESEVLWIPAADPILWAFYRDVASVDGKPVADRGERLARLFDAGVTAVAQLEAGRILAESSRFNLGDRQRNTTSPTLALLFLHPSHQSHCRFEARGAVLVAGQSVLQVHFTESGRPTLIRSPFGRDRPARGRFEIAVADGAVLRTQLLIPGAPAQFEARYQRDAGTGLLVPVEFRERYGRGTPEEVEAVATYSGFQRGETEVGFKLIR